jgi:mono/diheme cytochrome c family protein
MAVLAGCGGTGRLDRGRAVFQRDCTSCHTLTGHDTRTPGGDLAMGNLSISELVGFVRVMPVRLSRADVEAVATYVRAAQKRRRS